MRFILIALMILGCIVTIIVGTRISLYFYSQDIMGTDRFARRRPVIDERLYPDDLYAAGHRTDYDINSSARYARSGCVIVVALILLVMIAAIVILAGVLH